MNAKLTQDQLHAIKERAEKYGGIANWTNSDRIVDKLSEDSLRLLEEIERLQAEVHEHSAHNGQLIATHVIPTKEENKRLKAEIERLEAQEHFAEYAIRQNKALWEALSKACASLGADTIDYYEEEGGI